MDRSQVARLLAAAAAFTPSIPADDARAIDAWHAVIGDLDYAPAAHAVRDYYREESWPITPAEIVKRVRAAAPAGIPKHLQCETHPGQLAYRCPDCRQLIAAPATDAIRAAKELGEQIAARTRQKDQERVDEMREYAAGFERRWLARERRQDAP